MKNALAILTVLSSLLAVADTATVNGITWAYTVADGKAIISDGIGWPAISPSTTGEISIPSSLGGYRVTSIGVYAFYNCTNLTSVTIPDGVTSIGDYAFRSCKGLTSVTIPDGVTNIGDDAFAGCSGLVSLVMPGSVRNIGSSGFYNCTSLTNFAIGAGVRYIGFRAFEGCSGLTNVTIPNGVTAIQNYTFMNCGGLAHVEIPSSVTSIGMEAFSGCKSLTDVIIPDSVTAIEREAFLGCSKLVSLIIPNSVTNLGDYAFCGCTGLTNVIIGTGVTTIQSYAFAGCDSLVNVVIPDSVVAIEYSAFNGCNELFDETTIPGVKLVDGWAVGVCGSLSGNLNLTGVRGIADESFQNCKALTNVTIPDSVPSIGRRTFYCCSGLTSVAIPDSVTSIGQEAFYNCSGLTSVTIPDSVTSIGYEAFYNCSGIRDVVVSQYVCTNRMASVFASAYRSITNVVISCGVTSIGGRAFQNYTGLRSMTMPDSVTNIGDYAFYNCSGLRKVVFDGNAPSVSTATFIGVSSYCMVKVLFGSSGWGVDIPGVWQGLKIDYTMPYVLFFGNGGSVDVTELATNDGVIDGELPEASRIGYTCIGWFSEVAGGDEILSGMVLEGSVRAYAHWQANEYMVSFDPNGGQVSTSEVKVNYDANYGILPTPTRTGYSFVGWYLDGTNVTQNTVVKMASNHVLTASWAPNNYSITLNANGGSVGSSITNVIFASTYGQLPVPKRIGHTFAGWMLDGEIINADTVVTTADNHELMAQWIMNQYSVVFNANGGEGGTGAIMNYGAEIVAPTVIREGCTFKGWSPSVPVTVPASNVTFTAQWKFWDVKVDSTEKSIKTLYPNDYQTITNVVLASGITKIPGEFFYGCSSLTSVTIPDCVTSIGDHAFGYCNSLTSVTIHNSVTNIGNSAFYNCSGLASVTIPNSVTNIGDGAFKFCRGLTSVTIGEGVTSIGLDAFYGCSGIRDVTLSQCVCTNKMSSIFYSAYQLITNVVISGSVTSIGSQAFYGCRGLTSITIPNSVTSIDANAFEGCTNLQFENWGGYKVMSNWLFGYTNEAEATISDADKIRGILDDALNGCTALKELVFTEKSVLRSVGSGALKGCTELTRLVLPQSLESIGVEAFMGCSYLQNVIVPESVKSVGARAFKNCTGFTNAQIEHGVESLGEEAFYGCWRITEVDIPASVSSIGINAFGGDSSITNVNLRGDVRSVPEIFSNYKAINTATIKKGERSLLNGLFAGCSSLRSVYVQGDCLGVNGSGTTFYSGTPYNLVTYVGNDSTGWDGTPGSHSLPQKWPLYGDYRRAIEFRDVATSIVNFDSNGGTLGIRKMEQCSGNKFSFPSQPERTDYMFLGWWTEPFGGVRVTEDTVFLNGVYETLYAHWNYVELSVNVDAYYTTGADGTRAFDLGACVESLSEPKITVKGLPTGLKFNAKTGTISGKATKPGMYTVTVSATNATVKKPVTATFELTVANLASEVLANLEQGTEAYGKIVCGVAFDPGLVDCSPEDGWTVKVAGLPAGLKFTAKDIIDSKTKQVTVPANTIYGVPTKAGTFTVTFTASKKGEKNQTATITLNVEAAPDWAIGTFSGYVRRDGGIAPCQDAHGSATMTVAANGKVSGKISLDGTNWTFKADSYSTIECRPAIVVDGVIETNFVINAVATAGKAKRAVELRVASGGAVARDARPYLINGKAEGESDDGEWSLALWRNVWKDKSTAAAAKAEIAKWEGVYTVSLDSGTDYGSGYLSLTVGKDGNVKATGKLADGTSVTATSPLVYDDEEGWLAYLYAAPSAYKGGAFALSPGFEEDEGGRRVLANGLGISQWSSRNPQATGQYGDGFDRGVSFTGAYYNKLDTLRKYYDSLRVSMDGVPALAYSFKDTHLNGVGKKVTESESREADAVNTLDDAGMTVTVNEKGALVVAKATKPVQDKATKEWRYDGANDGALTLSFAQATGIFKGTYTFWYDYESAHDETTGKTTAAHTSKKVNFEGITVQGASSLSGFYLWDASGSYFDEKAKKEKTYKYKQSYPVWLRPRAGEPLGLALLAPGWDFRYTLREFSPRKAK